MNFKIENTQVNGLARSIVNSGNSYRTEIRTENDYNGKDYERAVRLGAVPTGSGHDTFLNGVTVIMDITAPLYWWKQAQRYHWLEFISSQSTMHCITKFKIAERCVNETDPCIIKIVQAMVDKYNNQTEAIKNGDIKLIEEHKDLWRTIIASLPCGFCLSATMVTNYRQIKTMCMQRKNHPLKEWNEFIKWAISLPNFSEITGITLD